VAFVVARTIILVGGDRGGGGGAVSVVMATVERWLGEEWLSAPSEMVAWGYPPPLEVGYRIEGAMALIAAGTG
jgi:hypothetical protein